MDGKATGQSRFFLLLIPLACSPLALLVLYPSVGDWTVFFGRFHPVVLHMPIGILMLTAFMEGLNTLSRGRLRLTTFLPLFLGTMSAVAAMTLGVLLMSGEGMEGDLVQAHFLWGVITAALAVVALAIRCLPRFPASPARHSAYLVTLFTGCLVMTWASHLGASITHGETYLTDYIPWRSDEVSDEDAALALALTMPADERMIYEHAVVPIFVNKCYDCHQTRSFKGRLVMDTYEGLLEGGATGPAIVPGDLEASLAIARVHLPLSDEEHMPPANEPQMTDDEIAVIEWWVQRGAPNDATIASLAPDEPIEQSLEAVTQALLAELAADPEDHAYHEPTPEEVAELRAPLRDAVDALAGKYPGVVRYESALSDTLVVRSFHDAWTDDRVNELAPVAERVARLYLPGATLSESSGSTLNAMTQLEVLDVRNAEVGDDWLATLDLPGLKRLNLFGTAVTDDSLEALAQFTGLDILFLGQTDLTPAAVAELRERLPGCEIRYEPPVHPTESKS
ncbi:MAG: c-type cytochrome domain-containing protein [Planctomycetota bacterium]